MSPSAFIRGALAGLLIVLTSALCAPSAADVEDSDVDLTLSEGGAEFTNTVGMKFVRVGRGSFLMGAPNGEKQAETDETPQHKVEITKDFYLAIHEVTQKQYKAVMGTNPGECSATGVNRDRVKGMITDDFPVEMVTWNDATAFVKKLNAVSAEAAFRVRYRLPTEAEWEYACRGGPDASDKPFHFDKPTDSISSTQANFDGGSPYDGGARGVRLGRTCKVGSYKPNKLGLYDMHGNVWEWCSDWFVASDYRDSPLKDPLGPGTGTLRAFRGGSYIDGGDRCRVANRAGKEPTFCSGVIGFRVAATPR
jgi:formylglycine-generating enzyme required for sulfatase activity